MTQRVRCSVYIATSLDGFIARSDDSLDWLQRVERPGEDYGYAEFMQSVDTLVMGRRTYDTVCAFASWPYTGKRCLVATHHPAVSKHGERFVEGAPPSLVEMLAREGARHAYIDGGNLIRQFLAADCIDTLTVSVIPVVLGSGVPLWQSGQSGADLELLSSQSWPSGLVQLRYRVIRDAAR